MGQALQIPYDLLAQILHVIIFLLDEDGGSIDVAKAAEAIEDGIPKHAVAPAYDQHLFHSIHL